MGKIKKSSKICQKSRISWKGCKRYCMVYRVLIVALNYFGINLLWAEIIRENIKHGFLFIFSEKSHFHIFESGTENCSIVCEYDLKWESESAILFRKLFHLLWEKKNIDREKLLQILCNLRSQFCKHFEITRNSERSGQLLKQKTFLTCYYISKSNRLEQLKRLSDNKVVETQKNM